MKTKHKHNKKRRNAGPPPRNASPAPRAPSAPRAPRTKPGELEETPLRRLGYTAAGAAGTALVGSFLAREGWAPKTIAGLLTSGGAIASWTSDKSMVRNLGAGAMSAAGGQLALMLLDDNDKAKASNTNTTTASNSPIKRANAGGLPPGALESAFERARARMSVMADDARRYGDGEAA